ncbi:MAG: S8 family serine peptidase [Pyrinomonadaceae bacterium]
MRALCVFTAVLLLSLASLAESSRSRENGFVKDELLVKVRSEYENTAERVVTSKNAVVVEDLGDTGWKRIKLPSGRSVTDALIAFREAKEIESTQPNYYYNLNVTPNDPQFGSLYGMSKISTPSAWKLSTGSHNTVVAVIDTGIRYTHEDLAANMWTNPGEVGGNGLDDDGNGFVDDIYGYDFYSNDSEPLDETTGVGGHGTHTSGTIGAVGNNIIGVVGVNWRVRLMAIKIYGPTGTDTTSAMLISAYNYVRLMKERGVNIRVTNNSYSGCNEACGSDRATKEALDAMGNAGILNVFSAGNDGRNIDLNPAFPASYTSTSVLSVANSNASDVRNGSSNFGPISVDLAAPGTGILSTYRTDTGYQSLSGTSMASPHVAGAAALLSSYDPGLSVASLKATLMNSVDRLTDWTGVVRSGGRLNAARALHEPTECIFELGRTLIDMPRKGGHFSITLSIPANCDFEVVSEVNWIHASEKIGSGPGPVTFWVGVSPTLSRTGSLRIAGQTVTVMQGQEQ